MSAHCDVVIASHCLTKLRFSFSLRFHADFLDCHTVFRLTALSLKGVYATGYAVLAATIISSVGLAIW